MNDLDNILEQRGQQNGDYGLMCDIIQSLKETMYSTNRAANMTPYQRETIDMICHKLGRIATGDTWHEDHWRDIAGYATLTADRVKQRNSANQPPAAAPLAPAGAGS